MERVLVAVPDHPYEVIVGSGTRFELPALVPERAQRVAVITQAKIPWTIDPGREFEVFTVGDGETHKTMATVERLCRELSQWGLHRNDLVVGLGGGLVTDLAGFTAATYHRGVSVIHVATTLLGQVDAAIGGKTGVNIPEGKNLIGAFWQPDAVICDIETLTSLPPPEFRCGMGEVAKYHFLGARVDDADLTEQVVRCARLKADIVASDARESGRRAVLNYGHTLAHAMESVGGHRLRHGEAVAIGLVFAARLAAQLGRIPQKRVEADRRLVAGFDLPTEVPSDLEHADLVDAMGRDKKADDGLTFVLDGPNGLEVVPGIAPEAVTAALVASSP